MKYNSGKAGIMLNKWDTIKSDWTQENVSGTGSAVLGKINLAELAEL